MDIDEVFVFQQMITITSIRKIYHLIIRKKTHRL